MKTQLLSAAGLAGLVLACSAPAHAQAFDYGSLEQLFNEPVTTSATGSPQRSTEAPADMQIISQDEIRRSGEIGLPGILQRVAGIDVLNMSAGQSDVNVRGYNQVSSPRLLVLVNGRQVYLDHYGMTAWQNIGVQLSEIRQIEVVKGPNSALFGFNAVSGVVNIITFNPKFDATNEVKGYVGNEGQRAVSLIGTFKLGEAVSARLSAGAAKADEWRRDSATALPLAINTHDPERVNAALDVVAQLAPKTDLRVEGTWSNTAQSLLTGADYGVAKMITTGAKATLTSDTRFGQIQATAYQNTLDVKYDGSVFVNWNNKIQVLSLQDLFKVGTAHTFRISGEYRHNTINAAPVELGDISYDVYSASAMWNWAVSDKVTTTAAVRIDNLNLDHSGPFAPRDPFGDDDLYDRSITELSANATIAYRPTANDTVRVSYARGVQAPSLLEFGAFYFQFPLAPGFNVFLQGNPRIDPSIVTNYQLAYDHTFTSAKVGVRVFHQKWEDLKGGGSFAGPLDILPTATTDGSFILRNVGDSKMTGFEVSASGKLSGGFGWRADYTYTDVEDSPFAGSTVAYEDTTPKHRGNIGMDWVQGPWEVDANLHYVGDFDWADQGTGLLQKVDSYTSLSSRIGYRMENGLTFAVAGQNLLNKRQQQSRGLQAERRVQFAVSKTW